MTWYDVWNERKQTGATTEVNLASWEKLLGGQEVVAAMLRPVKVDHLANNFRPGRDEVFAALEMTHPGKVKVVIVGQDPYPEGTDAMGLSFSCAEGKPPSLVRIFHKLRDECSFEIPKSGDISAWAREGVLLINRVLTVKSGEPGSHKALGWTRFTDTIVRAVAEDACHSRRKCFFLLWGKEANQTMVSNDGRSRWVEVRRASHPVASRSARERPRFSAPATLVFNGIPRFW